MACKLTAYANNNNSVVKRGGRRSRRGGGAFNVAHSELNRHVCVSPDEEQAATEQHVEEEEDSAMLMVMLMVVAASEEEKKEIKIIRSAASLSHLRSDLRTSRTCSTRGRR